MSEQPLFKVVTDLIFNTISVSNPLKNIWDIKNISSDQWTEWTDVITSLEESKLNVLNNELKKLFKHFNTGDFWQILVLSRKFTDIREYLSAFNFDEELAKRSLSVTEFVSHFSKWIKDKPNMIAEHCNDALAPMIDNAVYEGNKDTLIEIFSVVIWHGAIPDDLLNEEIEIISNENTENFSTIASEYKDIIVESLILLLSQLYHVNEQDLRNEEGGLSLTKIISHLQSYM